MRRSCGLCRCWRTLPNPGGRGALATKLAPRHRGPGNVVNGSRRTATRQDRDNRSNRPGRRAAPEPSPDGLTGTRRRARQASCVQVTCLDLPPPVLPLPRTAAAAFRRPFGFRAGFRRGATSQNRHYRLCASARFALPLGRPVPRSKRDPQHQDAGDPAWILNSCSGGGRDVRPRRTVTEGPAVTSAPLRASVVRKSGRNSAATAEVALSVDRRVPPGLAIMELLPAR